MLLILVWFVCSCIIYRSYPIRLCWINSPHQNLLDHHFQEFSSKEKSLNLFLDFYFGNPIFAWLISVLMLLYPETCTEQNVSFISYCFPCCSTIIWAPAAIHFTFSLLFSRKHLAIYELSGLLHASHRSASYFFHYSARHVSHLRFE